jgi:LmbE family N-acetylglucosaminyl deacetylase
MSNVLVVATHPDDETLGCGGTLLKHKDNGDKIYWLIVTAISTGYSHNHILQRNRQVAAVSLRYKFSKVFELGYAPNTLFDGVFSSLVVDIRDVFYAVRPNTIYLPFKNDIHSDHRITFQAAHSCTKAFRFSSVKRVLMMETLSETEFAASISSDSFSPNVFVDITKYIEYKLDIMSLYKSELEAPPSPRSLRTIKALATCRGATANCRYAESFMLLKDII